jgi:predicted DNA-binding protein
MAKEDLIFNGVKLPASWDEKIKAIADQRGIDKSAILKEAIKSYLDQLENPEILKEQIRQALRDEPGLVAEAIQIYSLRKLQNP